HARADLPCVEERSPEGAFDGPLEIRVGEDEYRILAAELEHDRPKLLAAQRGDAAAGLGRAGEEDLGDSRRAHERLSDGLALALEDADEPRGRAGLLEQPLDPRSGERRQLR